MILVPRARGRGLGRGGDRQKRNGSMEEWKMIVEAENPSIIHDRFYIILQFVLRPSTRLLIGHEVGGGGGADVESDFPSEAIAPMLPCNDPIRDIHILRRRLLFFHA